MAFNQQSWGRISGSANNDVITLQNGSFSGAPNVFTYISATDTVAQIQAANYFLPVFIELNVNDLIYTVGTDGTQLLVVSAATNISVTTSVTASGNVVGPVSAVDGDVVTFNGTTGQLIKDSGIASNRLIIGANASYAVLAGTTLTYAGGGTSNAFAVTGITTSHRAIAVITTSTNSVAVSKVTCTANTLNVTFSADPGAATTLFYWAWV